MAELPAVEYAHADFAWHPRFDETRYPNDPYSSSWWNTDSQAANLWARIYPAPSPWPTSGGPRIGIIDSGVYPHPDLVGSIASCDSFTSGTGALTPGTCQDDGGHGTAMAGIIAAQTNNGTGTSAILPGAQLSIVRFLTGGVGFTSDFIAALDHLRVAGIKYVNVSASTTPSGAVSEVMTRAGDAGMLVIAAQGPDSYPSAHPDAMEVVASSQWGGTGYYRTSQYVEIAAPGLSVRVLRGSSGTEVTTGTSIAAVHVTAAAASLGARTGLDVDGVRERLRSSASHAPSHNVYNGYGHIRTFDALLGPDAPWISSAREGRWLNESVQSIDGGAPPGSDVTVFLAGQPTATTTATEAGAWSVDIALPDGLNHLDANATVGGQTTERGHRLSLNIDTVAPTNTPVITSPSDGENVPRRPTYITFNTNYTGETLLHSIELLKDGAPYKYFDYSVSPNTATRTYYVGQLDIDTYQVVVRVRDKAGNLGPASAPVTFSTSGADTIVTDPLPDSWRGRWVNITGTAEPGANVTVNSGDPWTYPSKSATTQADPMGVWQVRFAYDHAGTTFLQAWSHDAQGRTIHSAPITYFYVDRDPPAVTVDSIDVPWFKPPDLPFVPTTTWPLARTLPAWTGKVTGTATDDRGVASGTVTAFDTLGAFVARASFVCTPECGLGATDITWEAHLTLPRAGHYRLLVAAQDVAGTGSPPKNVDATYTVI